MMDLIYWDEDFLSGVWIDQLYTGSGSAGALVLKVGLCGKSGYFPHTLPVIVYNSAIK